MMACSVSLFSLTLVIFFNLCVNGCEIKLLSRPRLFTQMHRTEDFTGTCVFKTNCIRPRFSIIVNRGGPNPEYHDIDSYFSRIYHGCTYNTTYAIEGNKYSVTMQIKGYNYNYAGKYVCILMDLKNPSIRDEGRFTVSDIELAPIPLNPKCFLPRIQSISVIVNKSRNHDIFIQWHPSIKEDDKLKTCLGALSWRIRMLTFPNIQAAPNDFEVVKSKSIDWISLWDGDTSYLFTDVLQLNKYYSIQVAHQGNFSFTELTSFNLKPITYASHVYYFGLQEPAKIDKLAYSSISLQLGSTKNIPCLTSGLPTPQVKWISDNGKNPAQNNSGILKLNHVTLQDKGTYYCIASNIVVNPPKGRREEPDTWKITVNIDG